MTLSAGQVSLPVNPDTKGFGAKLSEGVMGESSSFGGIGKKLGGLIVGGIAAVGIGSAIGGFIKTGFDETKDASAGVAQLTAGIKSTGNAANVSVKGMEDLASSIQGMSGQTDDSIVSAQQLLLTFTNIKNQGPNKIFDDATLAAANMAAKMGGDASSQAILLGKALNDPVKGVSALTRVGVSFTQGQKDSIAAMVDAGDTMGAQKLILGELNKEFGGAAKAAGESLPGQLARTKRSFEDISQAVVTGIMPVVAPAIAGIAGALSKASPHVAAFSDAMSTKLTNAVKIAVPAVKGLFDLFANGKYTTNLRTALGIEEDSPVVGIILSIRDKVIGAFSAIKASLGPALSAIGDAFAQVWPSIAPLIPQVLALAAAFSPVQLVLKALGPALPDLAGAFGDLAASLAGALGKTLSDLMPTITTFSGILATVLSKAVVDMLPVIVDLVGRLGDFASFLGDHTGIVVAAAAAFAGWKLVMLGISFAQTIAGLYSSVAAWVANTSAMLTNKSETLILMGMYTKDFVVSLAKSIGGVAASTAAWVANTAAQIIAKGITLGGAVAMGVATAAQWLWNAAMSANPIGLVIVAIGALVAAIIWIATKTTWFQTAWRAMTNGVGAAWNWLWHSVIKPAADWIGGAIGNIGSAVGRVFGGMGDTIRGAFDGVVGFVRRIFNDIIGPVNGIIDGINHATSLAGAIGIHIGSIPHIPSLAEGATILPQPGGTLVRVAEAGKSETVVDTGKLNRLLDQVNGGTKRSGDTFNIYEAVSARATALQVARRQSMLGV